MTFFFNLVLLAMEETIHNKIKSNLKKFLWWKRDLIILTW